MNDFRPFIPTSDDRHALGAEALRYVITENHVASVPIDALRMAEHVAIVTIARLDTADPILATLNHAIDLITAGIRYHVAQAAARVAQLERLTAIAVPPAPGGDGGAKVPALPPIPRRPSPAVSNPF